MAEILAAVFELLFELVLQVFGELLMDVGYRSVGAALAGEKSRHPLLGFLCSTAGAYSRVAPRLGISAIAAYNTASEMTNARSAQHHHG